MNKKYKWGWCFLCRSWFVYCPACDNLSCNGTYGTLDGFPCPYCPDVYRYQDAITKEQWLDAGPGGLPPGEIIREGEITLEDARILASIEEEYIDACESSKIEPVDPLLVAINKIALKKSDLGLISLSKECIQLLLTIKNDPLLGYTDE